MDPLLGQQSFREDQVADIIAFMVALSDDNFDRRIPERVSGGLTVGGLIQVGL